jgi:hypothetical protein
MPVLRYDDREHAYYDRYGRVASVTQVLSEAGIGGYDRYRKMQVTAPEKLAAAAHRGRMVHLATEQYDNGLLDWETLDPAIAPYVQAYISWLDWVKFEPLHIEQVVYHETFRYAGRLDRVGYIAGEKWVVDLKSGLLLDGHAHQVTAYQATLPEPRTYQTMLLQLNSDGTFHIATPEPEGYYSRLQVFLAALDETRELIEGHYDRRTATA